MEKLKRILDTNYNRCPICGEFVKGYQKGKIHVRNCKKHPPAKKTGLLEAFLNLLRGRR